MSEKRTRMKVSFAPGTQALLERLRTATGAANNAEVIKNALHLMETLMTAQDLGNDVVVIKLLPNDRLGNSLDIIRKVKAEE